MSQGNRSFSILGELDFSFPLVRVPTNSSTFEASYVIKSTHVMLRHNLIGVINCHQIFVSKQSSLELSEGPFRTEKVLGTEKRRKMQQPTS